MVNYNGHWSLVKHMWITIVTTNYMQWKREFDKFLENNVYFFRHQCTNLLCCCHQYSAEMMGMALWPHSMVVCLQIPKWNKQQWPAYIWQRWARKPCATERLKPAKSDTNYVKCPRATERCICSICSLEPRNILTDEIHGRLFRLFLCRENNARSRFLRGKNVRKCNAPWFLLPKATFIQWWLITLGVNKPIIYGARIPVIEPAPLTNAVNGPT